MDTFFIILPLFYIFSMRILED